MFRYEITNLFLLFDAIVGMITKFDSYTLCSFKMCLYWVHF